MLLLFGLMGLFAAAGSIGMAMAFEDAFDDTDHVDEPDDSETAQHLDPAPTISLEHLGDRGSPEGDPPLEPAAGDAAPEGAAAQIELPGETPPPATTHVGSDSDEIISGSDGADSLLGAGGRDQINGGAGDDSLSGGSETDDLHGGVGNDLIGGDLGDDSLWGEDGHDSLAGGAGDDTLAGGMGDDSLCGGAGNDSLIGGAGHDILKGNSGDDSLLGCDGNDQLSGGAGQDELFGGAGDDTLAGTDDHERDFLNGGDGDDLIVMGQNDWANGGAGADTFSLAPGAARAVIEDFAPQDDALLLRFSGEGPAPLISLTTPAPDGSVSVLADGAPVATVLNGAGLTLAHIRVELEPAA